jgi:hypothetical protein
VNLDELELAWRAKAEQSSPNCLTRKPDMTIHGTPSRPLVVYGFCGVMINRFAKIV